MDVTIRIRPRGKRCLFFDQNDRDEFRWALSLLPDHLANNFKTKEHCCDVLSCEFSLDDVTVRIRPDQWTAQQIGKFLCMCYDSYYRVRYHCEGPQSKYEVL